MPLTALDESMCLLDSTLCGDTIWTRIYKSRPRADLRCRECSEPMHAKASSRGLRFFAHDRNASDCPSFGESAEHRALKWAVASTIRGLGCQAIVEATPEPGDRGGWRADVLGICPDGRRVAFEVQLASMTIAEGNERTHRYAEDGIDCVWLSTRQALWITALPSCHLQQTGPRLVADRGLARLFNNDSWYRWEAARPVEFGRVALGLLKGTITTVEEAFYSETVNGRPYYTVKAKLLVSRNDSVRLFEHEESTRKPQEAHLANLTALYERQDRVLQKALAQATAAGISSQRIRLGVPPEPWDGVIPAPKSLAIGNEKTGQGLAIWTIGEGRELLLWAIACPVASRLSHSLGASWRRRGVRVFVESEKEARRIGDALNWSTSLFSCVPRVLTAVESGECSNS
jgi:hypothetical protein